MKRVFLLSVLFSALLFSCENDVVDEVNVDQMVDEIKSAQLEGEHQTCAEMVFPVVYKMSDGTAFTVYAEGELRTALINWYKNNPEKREKPTLVYPVQMNFKGKIFTINDEKEMQKIRMACANKKGKDDGRMQKRIAAYLLEIGIPEEKLEATMGAFKRVIYEAKGKGKDYKMSEGIRKYFSEDLGLTREQIAKIQALAIRVVMSKEKGTDDEAMQKKIAAYLLEIGIPEEKLKATMGAFTRVMYEAKGKGKGYEMSEGIRKYFSEDLGLTGEQIIKIQALAIRIIVSKK